MPTIAPNGVELYYEDAGDGPAILLTHGFCSSAGAWKTQVEALHDRYRVVTWDMRGHARTASPTDPDAYSERETVADMAAILQHLGVGRAVIGGHSLGGYMSLAFHLAHPQMTAALVLLGTGPGYRNPQAREAWNEMPELRAKRFETEGLASVGTGPEVRAAPHRSAQGLANAARGMLRQFESRVIDSLPSVAVPTLVAVGEHDTPYLDGSSYMARKIPGARHVVIPGAGHAAQVEQPQAFNRELSDFLAGVTWP